MKWLCKIIGHRIDKNETVLYERVGGGWVRTTAICKRCGNKFHKHSQWCA